MKRANFSPIQNFRKHQAVSPFLGLLGKIELITKIINANPKLYYDGTVALVKLTNGIYKTMPIHSEDSKDLKVGDFVQVALRLENVNQDGLKNYGLVAKKFLDETK